MSQPAQQQSSSSSPTPAATSAPVRRDDESHGSYTKPPTFNGDEASYAGWAKAMHAMLHILRLWSVVEAPVPGSKALRSEIGATQVNWTS